MTKQEEATRKLKQLVHQLGPGAQLPKFVSLREDLGVSGTTLIAVLDDLERQGVVVRRHGVGIYVAEPSSHRNIVLLCNPIFFEGEVTPFWELLVRHTRAQAAERGGDLVLHFTRTPNDIRSSYTDALLPQPLLTEMDGGRVHGILGVGLNVRTAEEIVHHNVPFVAFAGYGPCSVTIEHDITVRLGVEALAAMGCRRIALWSAVSPYRPPCREEVLRRPTLALFQTALDQQGLTFDPALVRLNAHLCPEVLPKDGKYPPVPSMQEQGRRTAGEIFGPQSDPRLRPDGIICMEDTMIQGALLQLAQLGIRPGKDIQIATHANTGSPTLFGYEDTLIRIEVDPGQLVREMYDLLERQIVGEMPENPQRYLKPVVILPVSERDGKQKSSP